MDDPIFLNHYNKTLLNGLSRKLLDLATCSLLLMCLFLPAILLRQDHQVTALIFNLLSLIGATGVVILALVFRELEKKRVQL